MKSDQNQEAPPNRKRRSRHRSHNGRHSASQAPADPDQGSQPEPNTLEVLLKQLRELREYASYYLTARTDQLRHALRCASLRIVAALLLLLAVGGLIVSANWIVLSGAAEGLGLLFGGRLWLGKIVAGLVPLAVLGTWICAAVAMRRRAQRERTVEKYEQRQADQQAEFGHGIREQSAAANARK